MPNIQFLSAENEIQKLYSQLGLVVPVGDLSTGKAPAVQPLSTSSTQTSVTASFNVMTGADLTAMSYTVNDGEAQSITPSKGVVTVTLTDLEYNSGPYTIKLTATNETGSTNVTATVALQHYTNWATPDEVLEGNKYIGEDGEEHVGEMQQGILPSGTLEITENGEGIDVTNYAAVDVNVQQGPTTGGAVISSAVLSNDGGYDCDITFETMPALDTDNHLYGFLLSAVCYNYNDQFAEDTNEKYIFISEIDDQYTLDEENGTLKIIDVREPRDYNENMIASTSGYLLVYEDNWNNLLYKIHCTITNPDAQPNL